jgi:hypothetical protein
MARKDRKWGCVEFVAHFCAILQLHKITDIYHCMWKNCPATFYSLLFEYTALYIRGISLQRLRNRNLIILNISVVPYY